MVDLGLVQVQLAVGRYEAPPAVLLVNPRVCTPSSTRLPLAVLNLAAVLEGRWPWRIVDGNVEEDQVGAVLAAVGSRPHVLVGISTMPGPQMVSAIDIVRAAPGLPLRADRLGADTFRRFTPTPPSMRRTSTT